jgi:hypothetical protein
MKLKVTTRRAFNRPARPAARRGGAQPSAPILRAAARLMLAATQALRLA